MAQLSAERLGLLFRLAQTFNSSLDLDQVLSQVIDEVIAATHAERGFLMLRDADGVLTFRAARGMDHRTIESPEFQISRGLVARVASEGQPLLTSDAQSDAWLSRRPSVAGLGLRSILCVPLQLKGAILGVIYVDNRLQAGIFTPDDLDLLSAIASSASIAIENARLYQLAIEKGRMERELQVAYEVQASLMPREPPPLAGWDLAAWWRPARIVSGDFYDFISVDPKGSQSAPAQGLVIGDVSDKGMGAALFMALTRSIVRASAAASDSAAHCIAQANRLICADAANGMFVTLVYVLLDPTTGDATYVNAGHNPPLLYRSQKDELVELERTGVALGVDDALEFRQRTLRVDPGDLVLLYTDGVTDATNPQEEEFGLDRLRRIILQNAHAASAQLVGALQQSLGDFIGPTAPFDDVTVVAVRRE